MATTLLKVKAPTAADYQAAFDAERRWEYEAVDAFEQRMGFAIDRAKLEGAARVLACPLKKSPPNWQHGRVLYAAARKYFSQQSGFMGVLDIGTAKGFSALCLYWALSDSGLAGQVTSVDVLNADEHVARNTVAEVDGLKTLREILQPWPESTSITFLTRTGIDELEQRDRRVNVCFIDGKHSGAVVAHEGHLLAKLQQPGDLAIFDDVHLEDVADAVKSLKPLYELETLKILPNRAYAIGVRRG